MIRPELPTPVLRLLSLLYYPTLQLLHFCPFFYPMWTTTERQYFDTLGGMGAERYEFVQLHVGIAWVGSPENEAERYDYIMATLATATDARLHLSYTEVVIGVQSLISLHDLGEHRVDAMKQMSLRLLSVYAYPLGMSYCMFKIIDFMTIVSGYIKYYAWEHGVPIEAALRINKPELPIEAALLSICTKKNVGDSLVGEVCSDVPQESV